MEDKTLNPGEIPEDMPALDLESVTDAVQPQEVLPLEPLFEEESNDTPVEEVVVPQPEEEELPPCDDPAEEVVVLDAAPRSAAAPAVEVPKEDPAGEAVKEEPAAEAAVEPPVEEIPEVPAETVEAPSAPVASAPAEELPPRDFSQFDIPMDESTPEPQLPAVPADETTQSEPEAAFTAGPPARPEDSPSSGDTVIFDPKKLEDPASGGMEPPYQEKPLESALEDEEEFTDMDSGAAQPPADKPAAPSKPAEGSKPVRKTRPKPKKGDGLWGIPHLLATFLWLAIILAIGVSLGRMLWLCAADVLAFGRESKEVVITIQSDDSIDDIAQILYEKGLINYPGLFKLYAGIAVDEGEISPGTYTLNTILDYHALVGSMSSSSSSRAVVEDVLIPEGYNCRQIFELLEQHGICTVAELEEYAANGEFQDFWFLEGVERGNKYCLEGFLFPDTYDFYSGSTPREAIGKMLLGFNARIDQETVTTQLTALNERLSAMMRANGCSEEFIAENQLGLYELLTVASLIEEETAGASESPTIASVIFNRLTQNEVYERYLGIDAAIIYATGSPENIDTGIDSPYNTYINAGLTPTPISNPGLSSINAALDFEDTDYYYYVLNPETQLHQFSKTYEEHQEWVEKFRGDGE